MGKIFMASGVLASITIVLIGLFKLLIGKFKGKCWYRPLLTILTLVISVSSCLLCEVFILELPIVSLSCLILIISTIAEVFLGYNGVYEGLNLKDGVHKLIEHLKQLKALSPEAKAVNKIEEVLKKYDITTENFAGIVSKVSVPKKEKTE